MQSSHFVSVVLSDTSIGKVAFHSPFRNISETALSLWALIIRLMKNKKLMMSVFFVVRVIKCFKSNKIRRVILCIIKPVMMDKKAW